jgi:hypothetical protein
MSEHPSLARTSAAVAAVFGAAAICAAAEPTVEELTRQLEELTAKVEQLERQQAERNRAASRPSGAATDAALAEIRREAERRSQMFAVEGFTAGYDKGKFILQSADGNFLFHPNAQFQFRYVGNFANETGNGDSYEDGFTLRRVKFGFDGHLWSKNLKYNFVWATNRSNGNSALEDAYVEYTFESAPDWTIKAGQYKDPTFHEETVSSKRQLAVDRSLMNELIAGAVTDRIQGVSVIYSPKEMPFRVEVGYGDGVNTDNTDFLDAGGSGDFDVANPHWGAFARAEYFVFGDRKNYADFTARGNKQDLLVIGAGASYTDAGSYALLHTVDAQYETGPMGIYVAYVGVQHENGQSHYDHGYVGQIGYLVHRDWEPFFRASRTQFDDIDDSFCEFTLGVNWYHRDHNSKFTADVTLLPDGADSDSGLGVVSSDDEQFILRLQYQLVL